MPGRRSTTVNAPDPSVTAVRVFSMTAALAASTVTPGSTAPDASLTRPEIEACAYADTGRAVMATITPIRRKAHNMSVLLPAATRSTTTLRTLAGPQGPPRHE